MKKIFNLPIIILMALMGSFSLTTKASESPTHTVPLQEVPDPELKPYLAENISNTRP